MKLESLFASIVRSFHEMKHRVVTMSGTLHPVAWEVLGGECVFVFFGDFPFIRVLSHMYGFLLSCSSHMFD
jgi:hypothetical protein